MWTKKLVINCFLSLAFVSLIQCTETEGNTCLRFTTKPDVLKFLPSKTGTLLGRTGTHQLTRHHIIPFDFLKDFFNFAATANVDEPLRIAINNEIRQLMDTYVNNKAIITDALKAKIRVTSRHDTVIRAIKLFFAWLPGNIFYGPDGGKRSDDPNGKFEVGCYGIVGDTNYKFLGNLYIKMVNFVDSPSHRNADIFREIVADLMTLFTNRTPFEYNIAQWELDPNERARMRIHQVERDDKPKIPTPPTTAAPPTTDCFAEKLIQIVEDTVDRKFNN